MRSSVRENPLRRKRKLAAVVLPSAHRARMHIKKLKVRKGRGASLEEHIYHFFDVSNFLDFTAGYQTPCAAETVAMLSCWATSKDIHNTNACLPAAQALQDCMRASVSSNFSTRHSVCSLLFLHRLWVRSESRLLSTITLHACKRYSSDDKLSLEIQLGRHNLARHPLLYRKVDGMRPRSATPPSQVLLSGCSCDAPT